MKVFVLISLVWLFGCKISDKRPENNNFSSERVYKDSSFNKFVENFPLGNLPACYTYSCFKTMQSKSISESISANNLAYVANYVNFLENDERMNFVKYAYVERFDNEGDFFILLYSEFIDIKHSYRIILATYSKNDFQVISKIIVYSNYELNHLVQSEISSNLEINLTTLYDLSVYDDGIIDDKYFYVQEFNSRYQILNNGHIELIEEINKGKYIAERDSNMLYKYPVDAEKK